MDHPQARLHAAGEVERFRPFVRVNFRDEELGRVERRRAGEVALKHHGIPGAVDETAQQVRIPVVRHAGKISTPEIAFEDCLQLEEPDDEHSTRNHRDHRRRCDLTNPESTVVNPPVLRYLQQLNPNQTISTRSIIFMSINTHVHLYKGVWHARPGCAATKVRHRNRLCW